MKILLYFCAVFYMHFNNSIVNSNFNFQEIEIENSSLFESSFMHYSIFFCLVLGKHIFQMKWLVIRTILPFTGSWMYSIASGGGVTEIRIESCWEARAQFYDGYTVNKTGKWLCLIFFFKFNLFGYIIVTNESIDTNQSNWSNCIFFFLLLDIYWDFCCIPYKNKYIKYKQINGILFANKLTTVDDFSDGKINN